MDDDVTVDPPLPDLTGLIASSSANPSLGLWWARRIPDDSTKVSTDRCSHRLVINKHTESGTLMCTRCTEMIHVEIQGDQSQLDVLRSRLADSLGDPSALVDLAEQLHKVEKMLDLDEQMIAANRRLVEIVKTIIETVL